MRDADVLYGAIRAPKFVPPVETCHCVCLGDFLERRRACVVRWMGDSLEHRLQRAHFTLRPVTNKSLGMTVAARIAAAENSPRVELH